ncbi:flagella basal body P-ring formation protein FlgA [Roseibium hamelinense]|uniref:Flagella basal body P-ring formation protein FlgA n=1 Tax=Roseibium hamelinense TaxID=150831 RepID=A0A562TGX6_9HYPH|nr:flagellar basal body P-ring formation chaperone FlgA [Roseibium hamelinense]MTI45926.1 flagellar basal body P-ring formation protein FlgA [Roseibium hamelinense]TWI92889.1 flagella basal body P-ring formation protein FlgA [Roseibium hamelinense]
MVARSLALAFGLCLSLTAPVQGASQSGVDLPVPKVTIHPGDELNTDNVIIRRFPRQTTQQFAVMTDRYALKGMVARRTLLPGKPIPTTAVEAEVLVRRGEPARLVFQEQGLTIVMQVEAMQNGAAGKVVRVRNIDSGLVVTGIVQSDGTIRTGK